MLDGLKRRLPTSEQLAGNRWLRWLGPALHHPRLWHLSRRGVALGVSIGIFFGLLIPLAQIPVSAAAAVMLRANVPAAVASTLVTNPLTFPPIYFAAWKLGSLLLGEDATGPGPSLPGPAAAGKSDVAAVDVPGQTWWARSLGKLADVGKPLLLGLSLFAVFGGLAVYALIHAVWVLRVRLKRRQRQRLRADPLGGS